MLDCILCRTRFCTVSVTIRPVYGEYLNHARFESAGVTTICNAAIVCSNVVTITGCNNNLESLAPQQMNL